MLALLLSYLHQSMFYNKSVNILLKWKEVYICPELTAKEQELNINLRDELKHRRTNGEKNLIIRHGQIIERCTASAAEGSSSSN